MDAVTVRVFRRPAAPVHGTLFVPVGAAPAAAVLVIGGSGGSEPSYVAGALAREGMAALSVAYFGPRSCAAYRWSTSLTHCRSCGPPRRHSACR
jgi:dienelactone hydrolase